MKKIMTLFVLIALFSVTALKADQEPRLKVYSKSEINKIAENFVNNKVNVKNPAIVDADNDGIFDMLSFTEKGNVELYKNTASNESPEFILKDKNYGGKKIHSMVTGMPYPVFFADKDGDNDVDLFVIMDKKYDKASNTSKYKISSLENTLQLDHYTLITVILILIIVVLIVVLAD